MRCRHAVLFGIVAIVLIANTGCFARWRRWRDHQPPPSRPLVDPVFPGQRPPNGKPEILMPAPNGNNVPALPPPGVSNYGPSDAATDQRGYAPSIPPTRTDTTEPPLARSRNGVTLLPPDLRDTPRVDPPRVTESVDGAATPGLPVGIPGFAEVRSRVACGQRPDADGLEWLKTNRFRTVLHLYRAGSLNSADRELIERHGLRYISLEVSAATLTRATVDEFSRIVSDAANEPIFVYDSNGLSNGAMWYLHFRLSDRLADEAARRKASPLGLKETGSDEVTALWLAVQMILRDSK